MNRSDSITHLASALAKAQAEMPVAVFDATNPFLKSKYASLGAVIQSSRPILAKHQLSLIQFPISGPNLGLATGEFRHLTPALSPIEVEREKNRGDGALGTGGSATGSRPTTDYIGIESVLTHESGEFVSEKILIPLTEEKGKSRVQAAGSTLTYLRRYSWASILGMYSDEDSDGVAAPAAIAAFQKTASTLPPPPTQRK